MKVDDILAAKGRSVECVDPDAPMPHVVHRLANLGFGALVVSRDGEHVLGVLSERDIVRGLARHGAGLLACRAREVAERNFASCSPADDVTTVMETMTRTRQRHLLVMAGDRLQGIVSIGDVVKHRLGELELERSVLRDAYIANR
jgi:CBS domain-containing protein